METLLKSRKFDVVRRMVTASDSRPHAVDYMRHPGAVVVLPLLSDDELVLLRNFRPAVDQTLWELPAGTLDVAGEKPAAAALRELEEEAGFRAGRIEPLCAFYPSPGVMNEYIRAFVARDLRRTRQRLEPTERIVTRTVKLSAALEMVRDGRIEDGKTIITLLRWTMARREHAG